MGDASWYLKIAEQGYAEKPFNTSKQENWAFFPVFPLLVRALSLILPSTLLSGILVSNLALLWALILLHRLARIAAGSAAADRAVWFIAFFPSSYFFSVPVTEALFIAVVLMGFVCLCERRLLMAGLCFAVLTGIRITGALMLGAVFVELWQHRKALPWQCLGCLLLAPLGLGLFMCHLWMLTGEPLAFYYIQTTWDRALSCSLASLPALTGEMSMVLAGWNFGALNGAMAILAFFCGASLLYWRRYSYALVVMVPLLATLATGTLLSTSRYVMVMFPVYIVLAEWAKTPFRERLVLGVFAVLLGVMTLLYSLHLTAAMT